MKITVIVPVYNERATIEELLRRVSAVELDKEIIVVDDCSTDGTREILRRLEGEGGLTVLYADRNQGRGAAVRTGQARATGDVVIHQDADLEYDPQEYRLLMRPFEEGRADVVYGSRMRGEIRGMALQNYLGNKLLTAAANLLLGTRISDLMTCYKAFRREILPHLSLEARGFEQEAEVTAKVVRGGYRLVEVPITFRGRTQAEGKKIRAADAWKVLRALWRYR